MTFVHEGERLFLNRMVRREFGKTVDELLEEISEFHAKEEQLLAQQKAEKEQLLAQQKAKEEQLIVNMYQNLHVDMPTIANMLHVSAQYVQEVLRAKGIV